MTLADEIQKLQQLHQSGALSDAEFAKAKENLLNAPAASPVAAAKAGVIYAQAANEQQTRQWAMFVHLSLLAGFVVPLAGFVLPVVLWQVKKTELPGIDAHGRIVVNWIISAIIYAFVSVLLAFVVVGIPLLIALGVMGIIFPIIGGIKASNGEVWKYPLSIPFLN
jgi:uncharacterized Tic20 family protein